ncbi:MAG: hypothetical protein ACRDMX_15720 [Solirubrobacteraceae bacterium]
MTSSGPLFSFVQVELPWPLGPPDGRYLIRPDGEPDAQPSNVLVLATLGAPERRRLAALRGRHGRRVAPRPEPTPVTTGRATVIDAGQRLADPDGAGAWLRAAGERELETGLEVLNRALHAWRLASADPYLQPVGRHQTIAARIGFGSGEQVADGLWTAARELAPPDQRRRRRRASSPDSTLAALLGARRAPLACAELALRARLDLDQGRPREAALQLKAALDAALAELGSGPRATALAERLVDLQGRRAAVADAARSALGGAPSPPESAVIADALSRLEAALRADTAATEADAAAKPASPARRE